MSDVDGLEHEAGLLVWVQVLLASRSLPVCLFAAWRRRSVKDHRCRSLCQRSLPSGGRKKEVEEDVASPPGVERPEAPFRPSRQHLGNISDCCIRTVAFAWALSSNITLQPPDP